MKNNSAIYAIMNALPFGWLPACINKTLNSSGYYARNCTPEQIGAVWTYLRRHPLQAKRVLFSVRANGYIVLENR